MEWEPTVLDNTFDTVLPSSLGSYHYENYESQSLATQNPFASVREEDNKSTSGTNITPPEYNMLSSLRHSDVLLGHHNLCEYVNGTQFYRQQVRELRPIFLQSRDPNSRLGIVRNILQNVWVDEGRFLEYHPDKGCITMLSNKEAASRVVRDLRTGFRSKILRSKASTKTTKTKAPKKKARKPTKTTRKSKKAALANKNLSQKKSEKKKMTKGRSS